MSGRPDRRTESCQPSRIGGLLEGINGAQQQLNPFGLAAFAGFVGLFTRHAVEKLRKVFDALFDPPKEDQNKIAEL